MIIKRPTLFHLSSLHDDSPGNPTASTAGVGKKTAGLRTASAAPTQVTALAGDENGSLSTEISLPPSPSATSVSNGLPPRRWESAARTDSTKLLNATNHTVLER